MFIHCLLSIVSGVCMALAVVAVAEQAPEYEQEDTAARLADLRVARVDTKTLLEEVGIREESTVVIMHLSGRNHYRLVKRGRFEPFKGMVLTVQEIREDHHAVVSDASGQTFVIPPITDDEKKVFEQKLRGP